MDNKYNAGHLFPSVLTAVLGGSVIETLTAKLATNADLH